MRPMQILRRLTAAHGALLIFDEVISGFRLAPGGAAEIYGIEPDLACFGKIIGGGLPVGAFGGGADLMAHLAPQGSVYQAGTLSGNPLAMTAGLTTLRILQRDDAWRRLEELGSHLEHQLASTLVDDSLALVRAGSLFWLSLQPGQPPRRAAAIAPQAAERYRPLFHSLLDAGIYLAPSAYEVGFLSLAHDTTHIDQLVEGLKAALQQSGPVLEGRR